MAVGVTATVALIDLSAPAHPVRSSAHPAPTRSVITRVAGALMEFIERTDGGTEPISITRCRELHGDEAESMTDQEIALIRRHAVTMAYMVVEMFLEDRGTCQ